MSELEFSNNFSDLSVQHGVNAGFQFDFFCQHCGDKFRSSFVPFRTGRATGWLGKAASMFGGVLGQAGNVAEGLADTGYGQAHDEALQSAIVQAKQQFHRCARCTQHVCDKCWNKQKGLCLSCAPSAEVEIEAARNQGEIYGAGEEAVNEGIARGKKMDVKRDRQLVCPKCGAETKGAKFCPECGEKLALQASCPKCQAQVAPDVKFCPECGAKMA
jgi:hypothetical protein